MRTFEDILQQTVARFPNKTAIVCNDEKITYAQLWERIEHHTKLLLSQGAGKGKALVIRTSQTANFLVQYLAVHRAGGVAVPLENSTPDKRYMEYKTFVSQVHYPPNIADILFTTGTTGKSKGVMISHEAIIANAENLIDAQCFSEDLTFIVSGPLNHIGSLSKVYPTLMTGATLYISDGIKDLNAFFTAFDYPSAKFATFLVPASLRILMTLGKEKLKACADIIDFIETGAAPMAQSDMEQLCHLLPHTRLYNTYASTETGIICTHNFNGGACIAGCLGKPMKHSKVFITEDGTVACQGKTLMSGYVGDHKLTAAILHDETLFTNDYGTIDSDGRLHLTGRCDDVINVGGFKVSPAEIENAALSMPEIKDCICIAAHHTLMEQVLKLLVVVTTGCTFDKKKIARFLSSKLESYKVPLLYEETDNIHRTYNGKLDRKYYRQ